MGSISPLPWTPVPGIRVAMTANLSGMQMVCGSSWIAQHLRGHAFCGTPFAVLLFGGEAASVILLELGFVPSRRPSDLLGTQKVGHNT
jgi:hypothetical protein